MALSQKMAGTQLMWKEKIIDVHVHCRDLGESDKATIPEVMALARSQGIVAIGDMPNKKPPVITRPLVNKVLEIAEKAGVAKGYYPYMGMTSSADQIREAVNVYNEIPKVLGLKMYAGKSVGDLNLTNEDQQRKVYRVLAEARYSGVLVVHAEKESLAQPDAWDPQRPYTWNDAKPPIMEIEGIKDQIRFALEEGFTSHGHLHIAHITTPQGVLLVHDARSRMGISCGVTPHQLALSTKIMQTPDDVWMKVNSPIRSEEFRLESIKYTKWGDIDLIESDHAPHKLEDKTYDPNKPKDSYMSGIPSMFGFRQFLVYLQMQGFSHELIKDLTYDNPKKIFTRIIE